MEVVVFLIGMLLLLVLEGIAASVSSVYSIYRTHGENRLLGKKIIRTRASKILQVFFLTLMTVCFVGGMVFCIYFIVSGSKAIQVEAIITIAVVLFVLSILGLIGFLYTRFEYAVLTNERIEIHRLFRKTKLYHYEEISVFNHRVSNFSSDRIIGYDKDGKVIFEVGGLAQIGLPAVVEKLREKGVRQQMDAPKQIQK